MLGPGFSQAGRFFACPWNSVPAEHCRHGVMATCGTKVGEQLRCVIVIEWCALAVSNLVCLWLRAEFVLVGCMWS